MMMISLQPYNSKIKIDTSLFSTSQLKPKQKELVERVLSPHSKSLDNLNPEKTGDPVWGAIVEKGDISIIPTFRANADLSFEFIAIYSDGQENEFRYFNTLDNEDASKLIEILTYSILTEESRQELYGSGSITITDLHIETGVDNPQNNSASNCFFLTINTEYCVGVSQEGVGDLCCKCEESTTSTLICESIGGGGGYNPPTSGNSGGGGGGGGGGSFNGNNNSSSNPSLERIIAYLDSMRNVAPDQIINNVDCAQEPCLCDVIDQFSVNPANFENLSNEVSQLLQTIFNIPNYQSIIITTSAVEGITIAPNIIATHAIATGGGFPISGMAYSQIIFNSDYQLSCTKAHLAATLLHESMHAYIDAQELVLSTAEFSSLYPLFSTGFDTNNSHHIVMANQYILALSQSLHNMFPDLSEEFVEALTWQGLEGTTAYNNLVALRPTGFRSRVEEINNIASCRGDIFSPLELNALGLESCF